MPLGLFVDLAVVASAAAVQPIAPPEPLPKPAADAAIAPNPAEILSPAEILALETERFSRLTVPVTIQGEGPFRFMIDTGAQATVLSRGLADELGLIDRMEATLVAMASTRIVETAEIADIGLGSRAFSVARAPILEDHNIGEADGILGIDSLQDQRVLFDFENRQLAVADARELGGNRGFDIVVRARRTLGQLIVHRARIDGVSVAVIIDTGAQGSIGNLALERRLGRGNTGTLGVVTDINGVQVSSNVKIARGLSMGGVRIGNFPLLFTDGPTFTQLGLAHKPAMVLGMSELHHFRRMAIDFDRRRILFDLPEGTDIGTSRLFGGAESFRR